MTLYLDSYTLNIIYILSFATGSIFQQTHCWSLQLFLPAITNNFSRQLTRWATAAGLLCAAGSTSRSFGSYSHFPSHPLHKILTHYCPWPSLWHQHKALHVWLLAILQFNNKIWIYYLLPSFCTNFNSPDEPLSLVFSMVLAARVAHLAPIIRHQKCHLPSSPLPLAFSVALPQDSPHSAPCNPAVWQNINLFLVTQLHDKISIHRMSHCHWSSL